MAHLEIALLASPDRHEEFIRQINSWEYPCEGKQRKGTIRPFVSEIKFYDIRIPEELAPLFLRDLDVNTLTGKITYKDFKTQGLGIVQRIINAARWVLRIKTMEKAPGERLHKLPDWYYAFLLAKLDDPKQDIVTSKDQREIL
jgi:hypothetical protein